MYKEYEKVFYVDDFNGVVKEGKIIENEKDGLWIRLKGDIVNTFVYFELIDKKVYKKKEEAQESLDGIRRDMKTRLEKNYFFIDDICDRLQKCEGGFYTDVIREIMLEKLKQHDSIDSESIEKKE